MSIEPATPDAVLTTLARRSIPGAIVYRDRQHDPPGDMILLRTSDGRALKTLLSDREKAAVGGPTLAVRRAKLELLLARI